MTRTITVLLAALLAFTVASADTELRQSTSRVVRIGPAVASADGITPVTNLTVSGADQAEALKAAGAATVDISGATFAAITGSDGWYNLTLTTGVTDTVGDLTIVVQDASLILPLFARFTVLEDNVYDALYVDAAAGGTRINEADDILADSNEVQISLAAGGLIESLVDDVESRIGTPIDLGIGGATLGDNLQEIEDKTDDVPGLVTAVAALETALPSDPADASDIATLFANLAQMIGWRTTITVTDQDTFVLADGPDRDSAPNGYAVFIHATSNVGEFDLIEVSSYTGASKTVNTARTAGFTIATGDVAVLLPAFLSTPVNINTAQLFNEDSGETAGGAVAGSVVAEIGELAASGGIDPGDIASILADTNEIQISLAAGGLIESLVDDVESRIGTPIDLGIGGATLGDNLQEIEDKTDDVPAILADTNELQTDWVNGGRLDLLLDAILADSNELQTDWANGGRLDLILDAILADTGELQTDWANGGRLDLLIDLLVAARTQLFQGTADSGDTNTMVDAALTARFATNDLIIGRYLVRSDSQACFVNDYVASSGTVEFGDCSFAGAWSTQTYDLYPAGTQ